MNEFFSDPKQYREYLEWKGELSERNFQPGDDVKVLRSNGDIETGWEVKFLYPDDETNEMKVAVVNKSKGLRKDVSVVELRGWNP